MNFKFPFNLDDIPKHPGVRSSFDAADKSRFDEPDQMEELLRQTGDRLSQSLRDIESDPDVFAFLFDFILVLCEKESTSSLQKSLAELLTNLNSLLIPEFRKFKLEAFSMLHQDQVVAPIVDDPVLLENAGEHEEAVRELRENQRFRDLAEVAKKCLALTMLYISKGLKYKRKDISSKHKLGRAKKSLLNGFERLFSTLHKMVRDGPFLAVVDVTEDKYMVKHFLNTLGRLLVSNLMERKLFSLNLLELFAIVTRHQYFDKNSLMRNVILALEHENQNIRKFIVKLLRSFLRKKDERQVTIIVDLSQTIMNNLVNKKNFTPESQFAKNCKSLYTELAEHHPHFFYHNYVIFRNFYASDSYFFRNIANEITFHVIQFLHEKKLRASYFPGRPSGNQPEPDRAAKLEEIKLSFLDLILARLNDKTVYTRSNTLIIISRILKNQLLDHAYVYIVFDMITQRAVDVSYNVRKRCLVLIQEFLIYMKDIMRTPARGTILKLLRKEQMARQKKFRRRNRRRAIDQNAKQSRPSREASDEESAIEISELEKELLRHMEVYESLKKNLTMLPKSLFSKNYPNECIESLRIVNLLHILDSEDSFHLWKMAFGLVWVKEPMLKQELLKIFHKTYIDASEPEMVVADLVRLAQKLNFNERLSFEEIIRQLLIQEKVFRSGEVDSEAPFESRAQSQSHVGAEGASKRKRRNAAKDDFM